MVHLYGEVCDIKNIKKLIKNKKIHLIEDAAQAHGAKDFSINKNGKTAGSLEFWDVLASILERT